MAELAAGQAADGYRVAVAGPVGSPLAADVAALGDVPFLPWNAERQPGPSLLREIWELRTVVRRFEPDVVHLHSSKAGTAGRLALQGRVPTVFQPHAWSFESTSRAAAPIIAAWERFAGRWAGAIVTVSAGEQATANRLAIAAEGIDATVPNPVDVERFHPSNDQNAERRVRRSFGLTDEPIVACTGRLCRQKGQDLLLEAWPAVVAAIPRAQLLLIGDGPDRARLEAMPADNVHFLGSRADVPEILRSVQVVAMPSRWEGMSLAMLEAMATAKPVVITDVGGARETVGRGAGAVVAVENIVELAAETIRRLRDPGRAAAEGLRGRQVVLEHHSSAAMVASVSAVYRAVLARAQPSGSLAAIPRSEAPADG